MDPWLCVPGPALWCFSLCTMRYSLVCFRHASKLAVSTLLQPVIPEPKGPVFIQRKHSGNMWGMEKARDNLSFLASWPMPVSQDFYGPGSKPPHGREPRGHGKVTHCDWYQEHEATLASSYSATKPESHTTLMPSTTYKSDTSTFTHHSENIRGQGPILLTIATRCLMPFQG